MRTSLQELRRTWRWPERGLIIGLALTMIILAGVAKVTEVFLGVLAGIVIPWNVMRLESTKLFSAVKVYEPLNAFAIGVFLLALTSVAHVNEFLAAFAGGITVATLASR